MNTNELIVPQPAGVVPPFFDPDALLIARIREGDEDAFTELVQKHHNAIVRIARGYVPPDQAEEIAQETWIAVLKGLQRFEGRSTFKTWLYRVVINRALTEIGRQTRANRMANPSPRDASDEPLVEWWHFYPEGHSRAGSWLLPPRPWDPEERLMTHEMLDCVERAIEQLPPMQRQVITLRDVNGWTTGEVCELLGVSEGNQRVLLHRARTRLREEIAEIFSRGNACEQRPI